LPEPLSLESRPQLARKARLRYEEVRQTHLLLLPERVVKLNPTGAAVLRLCDGQRTVREIVRELESQFAQAGLENDVVEFLRNVSTQGWVECATETNRQGGEAEIRN
jgi:pyrroloquinoline quinone biosynthesis protein D